MIAEVKTKSPFGWEAAESWEERFEIANQYGDWVSIHTDERWGGSFDLLEEASNQTGKPILAKGIHGNDDLVKEAFERGADYVLVVGRVPEASSIDLDKCLVEPTKLKQLQKFAAQGAERFVWNARDLKSGDKKAVKFKRARKEWGGWLCQASNVKTIADINRRADAVLVGTHLPGFVETIN